MSILAQFKDILALFMYVLSGDYDFSLLRCIQDLNGSQLVSDCWPYRPKDWFRLVTFIPLLLLVIRECIEMSRGLLIYKRYFNWYNLLTTNTNPGKFTSKVQV